MRPTDKKIQNLIHNLSDQTRPELDKRVLDDCFSVLHDTKITNTNPYPSAYNVLSYKMTRYIAAGFLLVVGLTLGFYIGSSANTWNPDRLTRSSYTIRELQGTVLVKHSNSQTWQPLTPDSTIYTDDQFLSSPDSRITFAVNSQSYIILEENSMLVLNITPDKTNLHLVHGTLDADLASPHGPFYVTTPHGRAEALGTEFTVKVE